MNLSFVFIDLFVPHIIVSIYLFPTITPSDICCLVGGTKMRHVQRLIMQQLVLHGGMIVSVKQYIQSFIESVYFMFLLSSLCGLFIIE